MSAALINKFSNFICQLKCFSMTYFYFTSTFYKFKTLSSKTQQRFQLKWSDRYPCLADRTEITDFDRHYIYHPAWAARILKQTNPVLHIDISSSLYFCSIVSAFVPIEFYDYRPPKLFLNNLDINSADLMNLPFENNSIRSLSCMHVVEHIGLGRYGDSLDPDGDLKAITELSRVVAPNGDLLVVLPIGGEPKIMFNAHRIYSYDQIISYFSGFDLREFSLIPDNKIEEGIIFNASKDLADECTYGCGCFWFIKKPI
jgi:hypothetical protein